MKTTALLITFLSAIAFSACLSGCADSKAAVTTPGSIVGATCKIQFKRDTLGANAIVGPDIDGINGMQVSLVGKFVRFNENWIVLDDGKGEVWVPRDVVLMMRFSK